VVTEVHYWNRANFEGLLSLAAALRSDARLERLARYCELREEGLRREAFAELRAFLDEMTSHVESVRRELALRVFDAHRDAPDVHQFMTEPLRREFVERVFEEWSAADPQDPVPVRALALLRRDQGLLREALRLDPADDTVRAALAAQLLAFVDYATHHLAEGKFIGDEGEAAAVLQEARAILGGVSDRSAVARLLGDVDSLAQLLEDWRQYRRAPAGTFPEWCRARGRSRDWPGTVYYDATRG
jgi:hypothetical protein